MRIGEIAKRTGLNISNIRFYERKGLLAPKREQDSQYRDYTEEDVLQEDNPKLDGAQVETYLNYVYEEEEKDVRFACISELMEDMSAYTRDVAFRGEPFWYWMYQHKWGSILFSVFFWGIALVCPVMHIVKAASGKTTLNIWPLVMCFAIIGVYACGFVYYQGRIHGLKS